MTAEHWAQITSVFRAAMEKPAGERMAYLDEACRGDGSLRRNVERLLAGQGQPSIKAPGAMTFDDNALKLTSGEVLAQYRVEEKIGEGGMGAVYRAYDTRLHRLVALKVLAPDLFDDPDRIERLMREARAASSLNHPNIVTIYEIGAHQGVDFIAMEFVSGPNLATLVAGKRLPLQDALKYAAQIAGALAAAHRAGIVHLDVKPANIIVSSTGQAKVLDFGLAKRTESAASEEGGHTLTMGPETETGAVVGTPAYMSPEQAEGRKLDARSDIFSFGAVLYEMVTGKRAFERDSTAGTLAAILKEEPEAATELNPDLPLDAARILARCLRKDPERRFQHMDEVTVELNELAQGWQASSRQSPPSRKPEGLRARRWIFGFALMLAAAAAAFWLMHSRDSAPAEFIPKPFTSYPGSEGTPSFSPDGTQVTFAWCKDAEGNDCDIFIKQVGVEPPFRLTGDPAPEFSPAWSPDGRFIAFLRRMGPLKVAVVLIPQRGGRERVITDIELPRRSYLNGPYLTWTPDTKWVGVAGREGQFCGLFLISVETGEKRMLTNPPPLGGRMAGDTSPAFSPDGRSLVFARQSLTSDLYLLALEAGYTAHGDPVKLPLDNPWNVAPAWTHDGNEIVFASGTTTSRGLSRLALRHSAKPRRLAFAPADVSGVALSPQLNRLVYSLDRLEANIWRLDLGTSDRTSEVPVRFISSTKWDGAPDYSLNGARIAFVSTRSGTPEIWVCDSDGSNAVQVTSLGGGLPAYPHWSSDGRSIAFWLEQGGRSDVYVVNANGGASKPIVTHPEGGKFPFWSPDGESLYFASLDHQIWKIHSQSGTPVQITRNGGDVPQVSPDGRFVYFQRPSADRIGVWRIPAAGGDEREVINSVHPVGKWTVGEKGLYFFTPPDERGLSEIRCYEFATGTTTAILTIPHGVYYGMALSPDGKSLLYSQIDAVGSDLMLVENYR